MRTDATYKELVKKYQFNLLIFKELKPKLYEQLKQTIELLDKYGGHYTDLIRNLRIDYARSHNDKLAESPKVVRIDRGLYHEIFSLNYSPENDYTLGFMYARNSKIANKRVFVEIIPTTIQENENFTVDIVFRISNLNKDNQATTIKEYYAGYDNASLKVFERDLDKPDQIVCALSIDKDHINELVTDEITF